MIWNILNTVFGLVAIIGAVVVAFWFFEEAHKRIKELNK